MAWLLLVLPLILLVLLIVPFRVQLKFAAGLEWQANLTFSWLFFTLGRRGHKQAKGREKPDDQQSTKKRTQRVNLTPGQMYQLGQKYLLRVWRALHLRCRYLDIDVLFAEPYLMGYVYAFCGVTGWPPEPVALSVGIAEETTIDLEGAIEARLYPIEWLVLLLRMGFEPPVRRLWWRKRKGETSNARTKDTRRAAGEHDFQQDGDRRANLGG